MHGTDNLKIIHFVLRGELGVSHLQAVFVVTVMWNGKTV